MSTTPPNPPNDAATTEKPEKEKDPIIAQVQELGTMSSIGPECNSLKQAYDVCFNNWFTDKFLKGETKLTACDELLNSYTKCVWQAIQKRNVSLEEIEKDHLGTSEERQKVQD